MMTSDDKVGGWVKKGQNHDDVILEWSLINHYFYKRLSLYIPIPNIYLGLGFEFGPERIRDLAIVRP